MIAVACATNDERAFRAAAAPTMERIAEGSSLLLRRHHCDAVDEPYNEMLSIAGERDDLEAIVLVHQNALTDPASDVLARVRALLATSPEVAVVGSVRDGGPREIAMANGTLLALSAWAARNLRFDPAMGGSPDAGAQDLSLQARAAGKRVLGARLGAECAWVPEDPGSRRRQLDALVALRRKWEDA